MGIVMANAAGHFFSLSNSIEEVLESNFQTVLSAQKMSDALDRQETAIIFYFVGHPEEAQEQDQNSEPEFRQALDSAKTHVLGKDEKRLVDSISAEYDRYREAVGRLFGSPARNRTELFEMYYTDVRPHMSSLKKDTAQMLNLGQTHIVEANRRARQEAQRASWGTILVTLVALGLAVVLALRIVRIALHPLAVVARHAERIGQGHYEGRLPIDRDDEIGSLAQAFNLMTDRLTEARKTEERRLHRAERMSDAALESLYDPVVVTDAKGRLVHLNRAGEDLFGPIPAARASMKEHLADHRIVDAIEKAIHQVKVSAAEDEKSFVRVRRGDVERSYRLRVSPMIDEETVLGAVAVLEDVTYMRELDRLKNEFIGVASHELRTPVTSLMLGTDLLLEGTLGALNDAQRQVVDAQREDLGRLQRLMQDLLDLSRLESGSRAPHRELVSPEALLRETEQGVRLSAERKGVRLSVEVQPGLPRVSADHGQIVRALTNLCDNAVRHTPTGGSVTLKAVASNDAIAEGNDVTFAVVDTGEGIPAEYLARITERFVQVPGATRGGAGLGLAITKTIVEAHGSVLEVESELGQGSRFGFRLSAPLAPDSAEQGE